MQHRIADALWGLFIADALAMPTHWFYSRKNIFDTFGPDGVTGYAAPPHPHPESFMVGMRYAPDVDKAESLGRPYDILHEHARYYETSYSTLQIARTEREGEHGNATPALEQRHHYHKGLQAGENTLAAHLVRVLMRGVIARGRYEEAGFLEDFIAFMTTPDAEARRDPYTEIYLRRFFENYAEGLPPHACAARQREVWSIGSHGGVIRPLALGLLAPQSAQGVGFALEHMACTHRSENAASAIHILLPLLFELLTQGADDSPLAAAQRAAALVHPPAITGKALFDEYKRHDGPGNIPPDAMWRLHTRLQPTPYDLAATAELPEEQVVNTRFATACYPEHGVPLLLYHFARYEGRAEPALLANANAGGDNVHRGMLLGLLVGAAAAQVAARDGEPSLPEHLKQGLVDYASLREEIEAFAALAASGTAQGAAQDAAL